MGALCQDTPCFLPCPFSSQLGQEHLGFANDSFLLTVETTLESLFLCLQLRWPYQAERWKVKTLSTRALYTSYNICCLSPRPLSPLRSYRRREHLLRTYSVFPEKLIWESRTVPTLFKVSRISGVLCWLERSRETQDVPTQGLHPLEVAFEDQLFHSGCPISKAPSYLANVIRPSILEQLRLQWMDPSRANLYQVSLRAGEKSDFEEMSKMSKEYTFKCKYQASSQSNS